MKEKLYFYDIEIYSNYYLAYFLSNDNEEKTFEVFNDEYSYDNEELSKFLLNENNLFVGFNNKNYDDLLVRLSLRRGAFYDRVNPSMENPTLNKILKCESDKIIQKGWKRNDFLAVHRLNLNNFDTVDIQPLLIGHASLKLYGARAGSNKLQELPIDPDKVLTFEEKEEIKSYCRNDLEVTKLLAEILTQQMKLRDEMTSEFKVDLRSKSDAQIAEVVIGKFYKDNTGRELSYPNLDKIPDSYKYNPPYWINFKSEYFKTLLQDICHDNFPILESGSVGLPETLNERVISYGNKSYKMGIGGIHSIDCAGSYKANDEYTIFDIDVASFYPNMILNGKFFPVNIGEVFLDIYQLIVKRRLDAKAKVAELYKIKDRTAEQDEELLKATTDMNALKITINGSFGKFGSKYSKLYSPDLMFHTTVSGQLTLLMLIERMEDEGIHAISANTDGIVFYVKRSDEAKMREIVKQWECDTDLVMEYSEYRSIFYRDVNNYVAFTTDDKVKTKGVFVKADIGHNPTTDIIKKAAIKYLGFNIPVENTVKSQTDIRQFLQVRTVKGGAEKNGIPLGKAIRWYYSVKSNTPIKYIINGNNVPNSLGGIPLMDLPDYIPEDLDYDWYVNESNKLIDTVNVPCKIGNNLKVEKLKTKGYAPCYLSHNGKTLPKDGFDFSRDEEIGTQTGFKAGIISINGKLYKCINPSYPSGWKSFIKTTGVEIIYGGVVPILGHEPELKPIPRWVDSLIWDYSSKQQRQKIKLFKNGLLIT